MKRTSWPGVLIPGSNWLGGFLIYFCICLCFSGRELAAQGLVSKDGRAMEIIESSSPVAGGGRVTSVFVAGQSRPVYRTENTVTGIAAGTQARGVRENSVIDPSLSTPASVDRSAQALVAQRKPLFQPPQQQQGTSVFQVPAASQIPSLGVPTNWDRSIRPFNCNCGPGSGIVPFGLQQQNSINYFQSRPSVFGSIFPNARRPFFGRATGRTGLVPLFRCQSFPSNAYAGQGIFGSPKLFVENQPLRNFFRYLWIP